MTATATVAEPVIAPLSPDICRQMAQAFPLAADARILRTFDEAAGPGPRAKYIMADSSRQAVIIVGDHPYEVMSDSARRLASRALQKSEYSHHGLSPTGSIFALLDGRVVRDPELLAGRQRDCRYGRAFLLSPSL
jgi:hypothetical protein